MRTNKSTKISVQQFKIIFLSHNKYILRVSVEDRVEENDKKSGD